MRSVRVEVLLSTYDGERWLADQLDSVLGQTHSDLVAASATTVRPTAPGSCWRRTRPTTLG